ncbi:3-deoxy-7-phosphoheptulonate synthase [Fimbriimonas ginsengisoli]|uniref:3-deoxy-7-phosphoheptulonate synthase n=1 Tax=Fimbriimonas ginsengisoli TaxID=1005039 RepID=UPI00046D7B3F|nr:3-deoxy-7-phosphoheptulonate synthase [Fimbriimonas ginsengisoli]
MTRRTDDLRVLEVRPLLPAAILHEEIPLTDGASEVVAESRAAIEAALAGDDPRLVVVVGPCSIHDVKGAREYAERLKEVSERLKDELIIVMRCYFEKPRTTVGWKGLINDPRMDGSGRANEGLRLARGLLAHVAELGLPAACEFLDTSIPQHYADLVAWGCVGARTTESQLHREMASGLSMPVGFKNATDGRVRPALDAIKTAASPHWFPGATKDGVSAFVRTSGNPTCHLVLRGGAKPNMDETSIRESSEKLVKEGLPGRVMVDLSHGNSQKNHLKQVDNAETVAGYLESGMKEVFAVMIESYLHEGRHDPPVYGVSVTDACLSFEQTVGALERLGRAVKSS